MYSFSFSSDTAISASSDLQRDFMSRRSLKSARALPSAQCFDRNPSQTSEKYRLPLWPPVGSGLSPVPEGDFFLQDGLNGFFITLNAIDTEIITADQTPNTHTCFPVTISPCMACAV
jgi:hypothetical protein